MSKKQGRTGARGRANIPAPATPTELAAARREATQCEGHLRELAAAHPSAKVWRARLKAAQSVIARAPHEA